MRYKFIDLFAGLGGFHLALSRLGCECVFASELRADLRKLYKVNFPGVPLNDDITKIHPEDVPPHDIFVEDSLVSHLAKLANGKDFMMKRTGVICLIIFAILLTTTSLGILF